MAVDSKIYIAAGLVVVLGAVGFFAVRSPAPTTPTPAAVTAPAAAPTPPPPAASITAPSDCLLPGPPPVPPDGTTAGAAEMQLGHDVMQNFILELEAYQSCRNNQSDHAGPTVSAAQKEAWIEQGNAAVDEANDLAQAFAVQLKLFKARSPAP